MSLRELVTGSDMCTPSDGAGPSNAISGLVNTLLGGTSKTQERLQELPVGHVAPLAPPQMVVSPEAAALSSMLGEAPQLPGLPPSSMSASQLSALMASTVPPGQFDLDSMVGEFHQHMAQAPGPVHPGTLLTKAPAPQAVLGQHLQNCLVSAKLHGSFPAAPVPDLNLSLRDQCQIRDRSTIMARHIFAERGHEYADQQVSHLLRSLHIDPAQLPQELPHVHDSEWHQLWGQRAPLGPGPLAGEDLVAAQRQAEMEGVWKEQRSVGPAAFLPRPLSSGWANEFHQQQEAGPAWVEEFRDQSLTQSERWVEQFAEGQGREWVDEFTTADSLGDMGGRERGDTTSAREETKKLLDVLSRDDNPKMKNSKFFQFLSKMSNGELIIEDNKLVERPSSEVGAGWAGEFSQGPVANSKEEWVEEFAGVNMPLPKSDWADEFAKGVANIDLNGEGTSLEGAWNEVNQWAEEFHRDQEYDDLWARHASSLNVGTSTGRGEYVFSSNNPFLNDPEALAKGKQLSREGLLTEAALALEAEVQRNPANAEAWRLLGTVQAENDDDRQAIAAMDKALTADPDNLEVLLALGVSHTNELDQKEAVGYLHRWLASHPSHRDVVAAMGPPNDSSQALSHVVRVFEAALKMRPEDPELLVALGVLHHLARQYDRAISMFEQTLRVKPSDYSLWNKLGATLANNNRSGDALGAYQRALDLKPNYMRAWTNMGISYANMGDYDQSARYYVGALNLNRDASHVWGYLRTSLACAGKMDLMKFVDEQNLARLTQELPL